jgi:hypothetical protein
MNIAYLSFWFLVWSTPILSTRLGSMHHDPLDVGATGDSRTDLSHRGLSTPSSLASLVLYDTTTKKNVTLTNNMQIVSIAPTFTIVATVTATEGIESVQFRHTQSSNSQVYTRTDNVFWYTMCGNQGTSNLNTCGLLKYGTHTVTATAFAKDDAQGNQVGSAVTLTFTIAAPPPAKPPTKAPTMAAGPHTKPKLIYLPHYSKLIL